MIMDKSQRSAQEIFFFFLRINLRKAGKAFKASLTSFYLSQGLSSLLSLFIYVPTLHLSWDTAKKEQVTFSSRDKPPNLSSSLQQTVVQDDFCFKYICKYILQISQIITLPQVNWNKQDVSVGSRGATCSFDLSCPSQETNISREKPSTRHDTSAPGSLDCLFGIGKLQKMLRNSGEIQGP